MSYERLLYGWSRWGLADITGYQPIAASHGFADLIRDDSPVWQRALKHCYNPIPVDSGNVRSVGWLPSDDGILIFGKALSGRDSFGRLGPFTVEFLYHSTRPSLRDIVTLLREHKWLALDDLDPGDTHLDSLAESVTIPVNRSTSDVTAFSGALLDKCLDALSTRRRTVVVASGDQILDALSVISDSFQLDDMLGVPFSTLETIEHSRGFAVAGLLSSESSGTRHPRVGLVMAENPTAPSPIASAILERDPAVSAAEEVSRVGNSLDVDLFRSIVAFLTGNAGSMTEAQAVALVASPPTLALASRKRDLRLGLVHLAIQDWDRLGAEFIGGISRSLPETQTNLVSELARSLVAIHSDGKRIPDVSQSLKSLDRHLATVFVDQLMQATNGSVKTLMAMPAGMVHMALASPTFEPLDSHALAARHADRALRLRLSKDTGVDPRIRAAILVRATQEKDCEILDSGLHMHDTATWDYWLGHLEPDRFDELRSLLDASNCLAPTSRAVAATAIEHRLSSEDSAARRESLLKQLLLLAPSGDSHALANLIGLPGLTGSERRRISEPLLIQLSRAVLERVARFEMPLVTEEEDALTRAITAKDGLIATWWNVDRDIFFITADEACLQATKAAHDLRQLSDRDMTAAAYCRWVHRCIRRNPDADAFRCVVGAAADCLKVSHAWELALRVAVGDARKAQIVGDSERARMVAENALRAIEGAQSDGQFGRRRVIRPGLPENLTWLRSELKRMVRR